MGPPSGCFPWASAALLGHLPWHQRLGSLAAWGAIYIFAEVFLVGYPGLAGSSTTWITPLSRSGFGTTFEAGKVLASMPEDNSTIPTWSGDPAAFESFVQSCKWYVSSLKETERRLAASRVWQRLQGAAKSVVRHLDPADYDAPNGLDRLLEVLRESPLQRLPVPDSFTRLEKWSNMRRGTSETIPQLLVREEELFTELQQALQRARSERTNRLLKAARLSTQERQHILTLTTNSTRFVQVRRALRTLFADETTTPEDAMQQRRHKVWYGDLQEWNDHGQESFGWTDESWWDGRDSGREEAYWQGDLGDAWDYPEEEYYDDYDAEDWNWDETEDVPQEDVSDIADQPEHQRYQEAFTIASEAAKTLSEARQAVAKVRAARGYYDTAGMKGSKGPSSSKGKGKGNAKGKGKRSSFGPCFICGSDRHGYKVCPDRFSARGGKSFGKKGKVHCNWAYFVDIDKYRDLEYVNVMSLQDDDNPESLSLSKVIIDTGATESVCGVASMAKLLDSMEASEYHVALDDRPYFKFGNGHSQRATSRVDLKTKALDTLSFYLLTGEAEMTPPLLGGRELWKRDAVVAYCGQYLAHKDANGAWWTNPLIKLRGRHVAIDVSQAPTSLNEKLDSLHRHRGSGRGDGPDGPSGPGDGRPPDGGGRGGRGEKRVRPKSELDVHELIQRSANQASGALPVDMEVDQDETLENRTSSRTPVDAVVTNETRSVNPPPLRVLPCRVVWCNGYGCRHMQMQPEWERPDFPGERHGTSQEGSHGRKEERRVEARDLLGVSEDMRSLIPGPSWMVPPLPSPRTTPLTPSWQPRWDGTEEHRDEEEENEDYSVEPAAPDRVRPAGPVTEDGVGPMVMVEARPTGSAEPESEKEDSPTSEAPSAVEDENEHDYESEHEHDGHGSVMMVFASTDMEVDEPPQRQDLQHLALRLQSLRARIHGAASAGGINYSGSQTDGMALHGRPCQWSGEVEPMGNLDSLQEVRLTPELCDQEPRSRSNPIHWAGTGDCADSPTGASAALPSSSDAGADLLGKDSGSEGPASRGILWKGEHPGGCQGEPTPRTGSSGGRIDYGNDHDDTRSDKTWDNPGDGSNEGTYNPVKNLKERLSNLRSRITNSGNGIGSTHPSSIGTTSDYDSGKWSSGSGQRWGAGGDRMSHLWGALRSLRERMGSSSPEDQWKPQQSISETNMVGNSCDGQHDSVMDHQSLETFTQTTKCNHQKHVSTTTTTECTTVPDILSVKNCVTKEILPPLARRIAKAAALTAVVLNPVKEIFAAVDKQMDLVEIACSPTSTLTATFEEAGMKCMRVNYKTGFDLDNRQGTAMLGATLKENPPRFAWVSLPCTRLSPLQNLTERDEEAWARFLKRRGQDLRRADEVAAALEPVMQEGDIAWEWPIGATTGWKSRAINRVERLAQKYGRTLYRAKFDGCQYGLKFKGLHLRKGRQVLTTSRQLWLSVCKRCDGSHEHAECRGQAAMASAYYPLALCQAVLRAIKYQWTLQDKNDIYLTEKYLLQVEPEIMVDLEEDFTTEKVMALSRTRLNLEEAPTGKRLEAIKQMMMRVHRASGHSGFSNLQKLLEARGAPKWAIELAGTLECPECKEAAKPALAPPASTGEEPQLFEILGTDIFEYEDPHSKNKYKIAIWRDRASGFTMLDVLHAGGDGESQAWNPQTHDIIRSLSKWLMVHPAPRWIVCDAARYYTSWEFADYLGKSGIGLTVAPAEAHYLMGAEEQAIGVVRRVVDRFRREGDNYSVEHLMMMAAHAMNSHIGASGFSAFQ